MSIHFQVSVTGDDANHAIEEFRKVFGALVGAVPAVTGVVAAVALNKIAEEGPGDKTAEGNNGVEGEVIPPRPAARKTRGKKPTLEDNAAEWAANNPLPDASNVEKTESASTSFTTETSSPSASDVSSVSIDDLRAKLMALSKTDGGHDKVFTILGKFGAKNASTVPEDKRGEVVALVDEALAGAA